MRVRLLCGDAMHDHFLSFLPNNIGAVRLSFLVAFRRPNAVGGVLLELTFSPAKLASEEGAGRVVLRSCACMSSVNSDDGALLESNSLLE